MKPGPPKCRSPKSACTSAAFASPPANCAAAPSFTFRRRPPIQPGSTNIMTPKELNQLVARIETHIECWKQFNQFINIARTKKFGQAEENNFLELKSVIAQEL